MNEWANERICEWVNIVRVPYLFIHALGRTQINTDFRCHTGISRRAQAEMTS